MKLWHETKHRKKVCDFSTYEFIRVLLDNFSVPFRILHSWMSTEEEQRRDPFFNIFTGEIGQLLTDRYGIWFRMCRWSTQIGSMHPSILN